MLLIEEGTTNILPYPLTLESGYNIYVNTSSAGATRATVPSTKDSDGNMTNFNITQPSANGSDIQFYSNTVPMTANLPYTVSLWIYSPVAGAVVSLAVIKTSSPYTAYIPYKQLTLVQGWQRISTTGTYSIDVTDARLELFLGTCPVGTYSIYKPQLEQRDHATPFYNGTRPEGITLSKSTVNVGETFNISVYVGEQTAKWADIASKTWTQADSTTWEGVKLLDL